MKDPHPSEFSNGELRERALRQVIGTSASMAALQQELATAERNIAYLESRATEIARQVRAAEQEAASLVAISNQLSSKIAAIRADPLLDPVAGAETRLKANLVARQSDLSLLIARIASAPNEQDVSSSLTLARRNLAEATRDLEASRAQLVRLTADRSELGAKIESARKAVGVLDGAKVSEAVTRLARELALLESQRVIAAEAANAAKAENDVAMQEAESARKLVAVNTADVSRSEGELAALKTRWTQAGLRDDPSESVLQDMLLSVVVRQATLAERIPTLTSIALGLEEWQRLDSTRKLEDELIEEAGSVSFDQHVVALEHALAHASKQLQAASDAQAASEKLAIAVRGIGEDFGDKAIAPFGEVFKGFLRALVRDSRFHRVTPVFGRVRGGANVLRFNLDLGESESSDLQVEMVLSEGQLSEVSLAAMLATSCIYPWSRWRGVLLDDPTQYQDLTHSTSLFEVIRNLASDADFQVIVAVHDRAQADFLVRKLRSARIPYVECEYLGMSPQGAVTQVSGSSSL